MRSFTCAIFDSLAGSIEIFALLPSTSDSFDTFSSNDAIEPPSITEDLGLTSATGVGATSTF